MFKRKKSLVLVPLVVALILTGCWDKIESDERAFVLALGIDHVVPQQEGGEIEEIAHEAHYRVTYFFPKPEIGFGGEAEVINALMSSVGENIYMTEWQVATRSNNEIFLGHLKAVVLGEEVVKNEHMFREILDAFEKDPLISRKISLAIVEGEAKDILEVEPHLEPATGQFIADLFRGRDVSARVPLHDLNDILISLHKNGNVAIPRIMASENEIKKGGAAIINNFQLVGWLGERESVGLMVAKGEVKMFNLTVRDDDDIVIPFQVTETNSRYSVEEDNDQIKLTINIDLEGDIIQYYFDPKKDVLDPEFLNTLQDKINHNVETMVTHTIKKLQEELRTDVLELDDYIKKFHHDIWRRVGDDWDEVFPTVDISVIVDTEIRRVGLSR
ncbi:Ger(x)C family spore germination protein [Alkaliphilus transvaalensis]|uniref:Ger(x)C family spore germination protein n=1 Tax=Alkaliphilus transvaalensis TaxID=114628 RepID=UPI000478E005|nr:Ger(x)C family spore germination protein [Alkaliphilus transvaalensis]